MQNKLYIGVDYYPEQWGLEKLDNDIKIMKEAGVNLVRLAEFAWCVIEPEEGHFDLSWLKVCAQKFKENGIYVVLCTPTCTPPLWVYRKYPETLQMDRKGNRLQTGIRGHRCMTSKKFRELSRKVIEKMAQEFADDDNVIAWQIDNELEANYCSCPECTSAFRDFLRKKYAAILDEKNNVSSEVPRSYFDSDVLNIINDTYGNVVWSGQYSSFEDVITPPDYPDNWLNPAFMLDHARFSNQSTKNFIDFQAQIIRDIIPNACITTNAWFTGNTLNHHEAFENLDFVSYDNYPSTDIANLDSRAYRLDFMRGVKEQNFWIMEQLSGTIGSWMPMQPLPHPGMLKGYALQTIAHGANAVVFFRFRTARKGAEMFWHGILDQGDVLGQKYKELSSFSNEVAELSKYELAETSVYSPVAILYDFYDDKAMRFQLQADGMDYMKAVKDYHDAFTKLGVGADIVNIRVWGHKFLYPDTAQPGTVSDFAQPGATYDFAQPGAISDSMQPGSGADSAQPGATSDSMQPGAGADERVYTEEEILLAHKAEIGTALAKRFKIIVAPSLFVCDEVTCTILKEYVLHGGKLIITARSGVKDKFNNLVPEVLPGPLAELAGIEIHEYDALGKRKLRVALNEKTWIEMTDAICNAEKDFNADKKQADETTEDEEAQGNETYSNFISLNKHMQDRNDIVSCTTWADIIKPVRAKAVAKYIDAFYGMSAAATLNDSYPGKVYYIGTYLERKALLGLLSMELYESRVPMELLPDGIEITTRVGAHSKFTFFFNNNAVEKKFVYMEKNYKLRPFDMKIEVS